MATDKKVVACMVQSPFLVDINLLLDRISYLKNLFFMEIQRNCFIMMAADKNVTLDESSWIQ